MNARVVVVLVNWNGWRDTLECLGSLISLQPAPQHVIVVDNDSTDLSADKIAAWCRGEIPTPIQRTHDGVAVAPRAPADLVWGEVSDRDAVPERLPRLLLVKSRTNRGFAGGNNLGIAYARGARADYYWLLNTDTVVAPSALAWLVDRAQADAQLGMVGSTLRYYWRPEEIQAQGGARFDLLTGVARHVGAGLAAEHTPSDPAAVEAQTDYVVGASMLVSRRFYEEVGPMCEDYFLYFEEMDWAMRGRDRFRIGYAPQSTVFHKVGGASRKSASKFSLRCLYYNRLLFVAKFAPESFPAACRYMFFQAFMHARRRHWLDVLAILKVLMVRRKVFREGVCDALA